MKSTALPANLCECARKATPQTAMHKQACPWEWDSYGNPMGNVPLDGTAHICISHGTQK